MTLCVCKTPMRPVPPWNGWNYIKFRCPACKRCLPPKPPSTVAQAVASYTQPQK